MAGHEIVGGACLEAKVAPTGVGYFVLTSEECVAQFMQTISKYHVVESYIQEQDPWLKQPGSQEPQPFWLASTDDGVLKPTYGPDTRTTADQWVSGHVNAGRTVLVYGGTTGEKTLTLYATSKPELMFPQHSHDAPPIAFEPESSFPWGIAIGVGVAVVAAVVLARFL